MVSIDYRGGYIHDLPRSWYKRSEFGLRIAIFFSAATVSGAFGGLLAVCRLLVGIAEKLTVSAGCNLEHGRRGWKTSLGLDLQFVSLLSSLARC
jgi:hypothetical protein